MSIATKPLPRAPVPPPPGPARIELARKKWQASGLTDEHANRLHLRELAAGDAAKLAPNFHPVRALFLPYFDLDGNQTTFFRVRYLEDLPGFAGQAKHPQRYAQPAGTLNEVYLPPLLGRPWSAVLADAAVPLVITEGELKAAAACAYGIPTLGLGGVDCFQSRARGIALLPQLAATVWKQRVVTIVYDSDASTNPNVVAAEGRLARELAARGADVRIARLPPAADGSKQGIDDFLLAIAAADEDPKAAFQAVIDAATAHSDTLLAAYCQHLVFVEEDSLVCDLRRPPATRFLKQEEARLRFENERIDVPMGRKGGTKSVPVFSLWLKDPRRRDARGRTWEPREVEFIEREVPLPGGAVEVVQYANTYQPQHHDLSLASDGLRDVYRDQVGHMYGDDSWLLEAFHAHRVQMPWERPPIALLSIARDEGTGRGWLNCVLAAVLGEQNVRKVKLSDLESQYDGWKLRAVHTFCEEVAEEDMRRKWEMGERMRDLITTKFDTINEKYGRQRQEPIFTSIGLESNRPAALKLTHADRRLAVLEVTSALRGAGHFTKLYREVLPNPAFAASVYKYLREYDLRAPHPGAPGGFLGLERAPMNMAKQHLIEVGATDIENAIVELLQTCPAPAIARRSVDRFLRYRGIFVDDKSEPQVKAVLSKRAFRPYDQRSKQVRDPSDGEGVVAEAPGRVEQGGAVDSQERCPEPVVRGATARGGRGAQVGHRASRARGAGRVGRGAPCGRGGGAARGGAVAGGPAPRAASTARCVRQRCTSGAARPRSFTVS